MHYALSSLRQIDAASGPARYQLAKYSCGRPVLLLLRASACAGLLYSFVSSPNRVNTPGEGCRFNIEGASTSWKKSTMPLEISYKAPTMISSPFLTFCIMPSSSVSFSTWRFTFWVTASRSWAFASRTALRLSSQRPRLRTERRLPRHSGSPAICKSGSCAALMAPQPSWPKTKSTLTFKWYTAYCRDPVVVLSRQLPATRTTNMSPRP
mmetsp:Transcript_72896/g.189794  ORF Transcript_72896/g.189794 Transcript_72896/m.189794 type:complete len:209 (+) Transcript_72896:277-903(+)